MFKSDNDFALRERTYHAIRNEACGNLHTVSDSVLYDMGVLDAKSADLLQFISVMLAALTFSLGLVNEHSAGGVYIRAGIFAYMAAFALAAWLDLRCLHLTGPEAVMKFQTPQEYESHALRELHRRRKAYTLALRITKIGFALLLPFVLAWLALAHVRLA